MLNSSFCWKHKHTASCYRQHLSVMLSYTLFAAKSLKHVLFTMTEVILYIGRSDFTLRASNLNKHGWHLRGFTTKYFLETSEEIKVKSQVWVNFFERAFKIFTFLLEKVTIGFSLSLCAFGKTVEGKKVTFPVYLVKVECPVRKQGEKTKKTKDNCWVIDPPPSDESIFHLKIKILSTFTQLHDVPNLKKKIFWRMSKTTVSHWL